MRDFNPFNRIKVNTPSTNTFDLSFDNKLTLNMGNIIPVLVQETLPGDYFKIQPEMLIRFAPLVFPIMHQIEATIHFFYVPNRICWENWQYFLANENFAHPYIQGTDLEPMEVTAGSLMDYLGLPISTNVKEKINAFPLLALMCIMNEYYTDQNNDSDYIAKRDQLKALSKLNGLLDSTDFGVPVDELGLPVRAKEHDYFTSALPFAQKGPVVNIPLTLAQLSGDATILQALNYDDSDAATGALLTDLGLITDITPEFVKLMGTVTIDGAGAELAGTINQLRASYALQQFYELNARAGTRYPELIKAHFGVDVGDARVNRPEYIGGIKNQIMISEVLQTSQSSEDSALGDYAGKATGVVSGNQINYGCKEHGFIIGLLSVIPRTAYFQGINKKFSRFLNTDYYWEKFAHLGEQAILNKELYYDVALTDNDDEFGYIPRYSEYKYNPSEVHGQFRTTMLDWHLASDFASRPNLNQEFIYFDPADLKRIFAVTDPEVDSLFAHVFFSMNVKCKIPFFTEPAGL